jgi:hypothetical protein
MGGWMPDISEAFFESSNFKLFTDASCWVTWELTSAADLKNHFTSLPLSFDYSARHLKTAVSHGRSILGAVCQLLVNTIALFQLAMQDYGLAMIRTTQVPFLVNLNMLLQLVGSTEVCISWPLAPMNYTVAAYKQLESLFLLYSRWFYCIKSMIAGVEILDEGSPASTTIQINPQLSFTLEIKGPIIALAKRWEDQALAALGPDRHLSVYGTSVISVSIFFSGKYFSAASSSGTSGGCAYSLSTKLCRISNFSV